MSAIPDPATEPPVSTHSLNRNNAVKTHTGIQGPDLVDNIFHVNLSKGYAPLTSPDLTCAVKGAGGKVEPHASGHKRHDLEAPLSRTLSGVLSMESSWDDVEQGLASDATWHRENVTMQDEDKLTIHADTKSTRIKMFFGSKRDAKDISREVQVAFLNSAPQTKLWVRKILKDRDISDYLELDMEEVATEIASLDVEGAGRDRETEEGREFLHLKVICLPDIEKPFVKVLRLRLTVWIAEDGKGTQRRTSGIKGVLDCWKYLPRGQPAKALAEAFSLVKPDGAWRVFAQGNTKTLRIRARNVSEPKPERPRPLSQAGFLSGPRVDSLRKFPASVETRQTWVREMALSALESVGRTYHRKLSLSVVGRAPDDGYGPDVFDNLAKRVTNGPPDLLTHLTQDVLLDPTQFQYEKQTGRLTNFEHVLYDSAWRVPALTHELGITHDCLSALQSRLQSLDEALPIGNPFVTGPDAKSWHEIPILDFATATFERVPVGFVVVFHRLKLTAIWHEMHTLSEREVNLVEVWESKKFPLRVNPIREVENERRTSEGEDGLKGPTGITKSVDQ